MGCVNLRFMISVHYHKNDLEKNKNHKNICDKEIHYMKRGLNKPIKEVSNY